ncbi:MAG: hypothetical protein ACLFXM_06370 [Acidimicrobiia bacterium]
MTPRAAAAAPRAESAIAAVRPPSIAVPRLLVAPIVVAPVVLASIALTALVLPAPAAHGQDADDSAPVVLVSRRSVDVADTVDVTGGGWQPASLVVLDICGNRAARGSLDCTGAPIEKGVGADGRFRLSLNVRVPPSPCPCVLVVTGLGGPERAVVPLEIRGHPEISDEEVDEIAEAEQAPAGRLVVDDARLEGGGPWSSWFGGSATRTLVVTVRNTGEAAAGLRVAVSAGRGDDPEGWVPVTDPGRLDAGEERTLHIPVRFDPLGVGSHTVAGEVAGRGTTATFDASTTIHPWGLYGLAGATLVLSVVTVGVRLRRRRGRRRDPVPPEELAAA